MSYHEGGLVPQSVDGRHEADAFGDRIVRGDTACCLIHQLCDLDDRIEIVDRFTKVDFEVLALSRSIPPNCCGPDACRHGRDGHASPDAEVAAENGVLSREGDRASSIARTSADVLYESGELRVDVEFGSL